MKFNTTKCNMMRVSQKRTPFTFTYLLPVESLQEDAGAKYLGCTLSDDLECTKHIRNVSLLMVTASLHS